MKMIRYIACAMCIFICATPGFAYRGPQVWFYTGASNTGAYNPVEMYPGGVIKYYVTPSLRDVSVDLDGTTHHVNLEQMTQDAMQAWHERAPRLTFQQVNTREEANYLVTPEDDALTLADARPRQPRYHEQAQLRYHLGGISGVIRTLRPDTMPERDYPEIREVLDVVLRTAAEHEIGHTLGLAHPNLEHSNNPRARIFELNQTTDRVHLMTGDLRDFLRDLRADLGRAPRLADIRPAPEEVTALNIVIDNPPRQTEQGYCEAAQRFKRSAASNSRLCMTHVNVLAQMSAPINNLLLLQ